MSPPLPDAPKKSPRVYRNLKTKTLEDVTFSNVEATGDPLSIELHNEDELRRLVLVQLARLTVKSEWTGLLTAAGGMTSFDLSADSGTSETVTNGSDLKILGGTGISTAVSAPDTITITNTGATTQSFNLEADSGATQIVPTDGTGTLSIDGGTGISTATGGANDQVVVTNTGVTSIAAGTGISVTASTGAITVSASGGSSATWNPKVAVGPINSGFQDAVIISRIPPWGQMVTSSNVTGNITEATPQFWPFVMPTSASIDKLTIGIIGSGDGQYDIAIYSDDGGLPDSKIETFQMSDSSYSTGNFAISSSSSHSYTEGTQYWLGIVKTGGSGNVQVQYEANTGFMVAPSYLTGSSLVGNLTSRCCVNLNGSANTLPATVTTSSLFGSTQGMMRTALQFT
jgi:hypothetical protein